MQQQQAAVESGRWLLYRYDPRRLEQGENPLLLDSPQTQAAPGAGHVQRKPLQDAAAQQTRRGQAMLQEAQISVASRFHMYEYLAARKIEDESPLPPNRHYHLDHPAQGNGGKGGQRQRQRRASPKATAASPRAVTTSPCPAPPPARPRLPR